MESYIHKIKMLIVDDDQALGMLLTDYFSAQSYDVSYISNGFETQTHLQHSSPEVILLDLFMPGVTGIDICRKIRGLYSGIVLVMTNSQCDFDQVTCLELGANDFITKPIKPRILKAKIESLLRLKNDTATANRNMASQADTKDRVTLGTLKIDNKLKQVQINGYELDLTMAEFDVLWLLAKKPNSAVSRTVLCESIRGIEFDPFDRSIDIKISAIRKKLLQYTDRKILLTIRGKGYMLIAPQHQLDSA